MTFSEYFNALYPYLSDGSKRMEFLDEMIANFIYEEAREACQLLTGQADTRRRYIQQKNPRKIDPEYAQYAYSQHNPTGYQEWLHDKMFEQDSFERVEEWLEANKIEFKNTCVACDDLLETIFFTIANPTVPVGSAVKLPEKTPDTNDVSQHLSSADKELLKDFCIDFDSILEKCIASDPSEVWFTGRLAVKINSLYNDKWKNKLTEFKDIGLQSDILSTISTLQNFCKALDPDSESAPGSSVRRLRIKLRDNYVKLHPDSYAGMYPYDAFIDDWNDENDFEM